MLATPVGVASGQTSDGKAIFGQKCASCHTIGGGDLVGPDLHGVGARRGPAFVERFIKEPDRMIAEGDPTASQLVKKYGMQMPNLGLTDAEVSALLAHLGVQAAPAPAPTPTPAPAPEPAPRPAGDADRGKNLFTGADRLANGAPPCLSCHAIAGIGALGGGALGPDLTGAYDKYGGATAITGVLATLPFPTMTPIFGGRPLSAAEQADLAAFLERASGAERPGDVVWKLVLIGLGAAAAVLLAALLIWPRRSLAVRRRLVPPSSTPRR
jgi:mono/diheme cytochrome c family protein